MPPTLAADHPPPFPSSRDLIKKINANSPLELSARTQAMPPPITVGVLALQGAVSEHLHLLHRAFALLSPAPATANGVDRANNAAPTAWAATEVRTPADLARCDALVIPGGESTAIALAAARGGLLEPLRGFVKVERKPTWGTCAGLILLAEAANRTKAGGQELVGGLDVRVERNHFGRQVESFEADVEMGFLGEGVAFRGVFIRAPIVEKLLPPREGLQKEEEAVPETVVAPSKTPAIGVAASMVGAPVEVMARLPNRLKRLRDGVVAGLDADEGDIVAVRQGNVFGTSFHPELTGDPRLHVWWLRQVRNAVIDSR